MPRITIAHKKESIKSFAVDAVEMIKKHLNPENIDIEYYPELKENGWQYYLRKIYLND